MSSRADRRAREQLADRLLGQLERDFPIPANYVVAFSGGLDSTVLLHLMAGLRPRLGAPLSAVHVDHRLQADSARWAAHCAAVCGRLGVPLLRRAVDARPLAGESPEAAARRVRYRAIAEVVGDQAMLLTAHHRDDQAETLLLQLLRGAGVDGLAAMPVLRRWNSGWQARPLLGLSRAQLGGWAREQGLDWIDDPSNAATTADRNFLRHRVLPLLSARWPAAVANIARAAGHCADAAELLREQARTRLEAAMSADRQRLGLAVLRDQPAAEGCMLLRLWLAANAVGMPSTRRLQELLRQLLDARRDAAVAVDLGACAVRRFRDAAWLVDAELPRPPAGRRPWDGDDLDLGAGLGTLRRRFAPGGIDPARWDAGRVDVGYRTPGLCCRPAGRVGSRGFKAIAQAHAIPPWQRDRLPVVWIDGVPAAIANCCVCAPFATPAGQPGWVVEWFPDDWHRDGTNRWHREPASFW